MKWFVNLKISKKLISSFILISLICGAMGSYGIYNLKGIEKSDLELYKNMTVPVSEMGQISTEFQKVNVNIRDMISAQSSDDIAASIKNIEKNISNIDRLTDSFNETIISSDMRKQFDVFIALKTSFKSEINIVMELAKENKDAEAIAIITENSEAGKASIAEEGAIEKIVSMKIDDAKEKSNLNTRNSDSAIIITSLVIIFAMSMSILIGLYISGLITKPLKRVAKMIEEMGKGHLGERLNINTRDEIGQMGEAMDNFAHDLQTYVIDAMNKIAKGDVSMDVPIKDEKDEISPALNKMIENIRELVKDVNMLSMSSIEGNLDMRADITRHNGDFKKIVQGINELMEAMVTPIKEVTSVMSQMSEGNLKISVSEDYKGEFGVLAESVNTTINSLNSVLSEINTASEQVFTGSSQVSDGSQALSQGATEQASAIEQLTSSITEVAAQTKENAVNANQAKELALKVKGNAEEGNIHMREMLESMGEINESSSNISKIIKVIDEIAFQTNILALNAAVEAARAGQQGKGFAVVAEEVRNLAARSANAAKETTALIEGSIKKSERGTEIANNTAKALYEIVEGVSKAATLVAEIAAASNEQATGISQINLGIEQVSQVVQTNSATAEESAAASEELSSQSEMLKEMVSNFKLKNSNNMSNNQTRNYKNKQYYNRENNISFKEVVAKSSKPKIALSDKEFGKY